MISYTSAVKIIRASALQHSIAATSSSETIELDRNSGQSLGQTLGRVLAEPLFSPEDVPSFTNSAMDGFALNASDTVQASVSNPVTFRIDGLVAAGDLQAYEQCRPQGSMRGIEIMTGAPLPEATVHGDYDAVVRIEDVKLERDASGNTTAIQITRPLQPGENIRIKGTDFRVGDGVLSAGTRIQPEHLLACASLGIRQIQVKRHPRISVISTGSELVSPFEKNLQPGMIRNSTGPFLQAALTNLGITSDYLGIVKDDPEFYRAALERAIYAGAEVIISTGAVSMGKYDFVFDVLTQMGAEIHFHKAAIRPGKPILFAEIEIGKRTCVFFGVPGNPVSTAVGLRFFVEPYLRSRQGLTLEKPLLATLTETCKKPEELKCFFKGRAQWDGQGLSVTVLKGQASYIVSALVEANCWVVLPEESAEVASRSRVEIYPLQSTTEVFP